MDPLTGLITVKEPGPSFDRELVSRHYLTVEARDDLGKGNRNTVQLVVNVKDVNDNAPIFLQNKYEAVLLENEDHFQSPLIVEAFDIDLNGLKLTFIDTYIKLRNKSVYFFMTRASSCTVRGFKRYTNEFITHSNTQNNTKQCTCILSKIFNLRYINRY